jgi:hypothetical protein
MTDTYINLGCGTVTLPCERPNHHSLVDAAIYAHPHWLNVDKIDSGADELVNIFEYPWPWADNTFGGALLSHIVEHIPHRIRMAAIHKAADAQRLLGLQDGWFAFFAELWRVLKPGAVAHVLVPHGASDGALGDPTHTRYVMPHTFGYFETGGSFEYAVGSVWTQEPAVYNISPIYAALMPDPIDNEATAKAKAEQLKVSMMVQRNAVVEFYVKLQAVKDAH